MNQFENLKLLYTQLLNISKEIRKFLEKEAFNEAFTKIKYRNGLIKNLAQIRPHVKLNEEETLEIKKIEQNLKNYDLKNIQYLSNSKEQIKQELAKLNAKIKFDNSYKMLEEKNGFILDMVE